MGVKSFLKKIFYSLPFAMKGGEKILTSTNDNSSNNVGVVEVIQENRLSKDLLKGEVTQAVEELRYRDYKVYGESKKYQYLGDGIAIKTKNQTDDNKNKFFIVENKVKLQSIVFIVMGVINVCVSLITSKYFGAIGASLSIFIAYMVRNALMLCIHIKVLHLDMKTFFKNTFLKITPFLLLMLGIGLTFEYFNPMANGFLRFGVNGVVFLGIFAVLVYKFVINDYEKNLFLGVFKKVLRKVKR